MADTEPTLATDLVYALAASPTFADDGLCFAACLSGLRRSTDGGHTWHNAYASLALQAPLSATSVAFSPDFGEDRTVFAGALGGVLRSHDGGQSWVVAGLPAPPPFVTGLVVSPHFREDGLLFAGTMEDGVLRSWDRGISWAAWNFGLLDLNVLALAISPGFGEDETLFVGVESGVFRSTNGGRAWRETAFPMECAPVLSLALSPRLRRRWPYAGGHRGARPVALQRPGADLGAAAGVVSGRCDQWVAHASGLCAAAVAAGLDRRRSPRFVRRRRQLAPGANGRAPAG